MLVLACAADRIVWARFHRPHSSRSTLTQLAVDLLGYLGPLGNLLPGRLGRWLRGVITFVQLGQQFRWLRH